MSAPLFWDWRNRSCAMTTSASFWSISAPTKTIRSPRSLLKMSYDTTPFSQTRAVSGFPDSCIVPREPPRVILATMPSEPPAADLRSNDPAKRRAALHAVYAAHKDEVFGFLVKLLRDRHL